MSIVAAHRFKVGEFVAYAQKRLAAAPGRYEVVRLLPEQAGEQQYRIRSAEENHERMAREGELVAWSERAAAGSPH